MRGLKYILYLIMMNPGLVASYIDVWIEVSSSSSVTFLALVASYIDVWIEVKYTV